MKILKAVGSLVIIEQKVEEIRSSGIVIAQEANKGGSMELYEGTVLAIGPEVTRFKKGDHVIFGRNVFATHTRGGKEFLLVYDRYINCLEREESDDYEPNSSELILEGAV